MKKETLIKIVMVMFVVVMVILMLTGCTTVDGECLTPSVDGLCGRGQMTVATIDGNGGGGVTGVGSLLLMVILVVFALGNRK